MCILFYIQKVRLFLGHTVYEWYSAFKSDRDVLEDLPRPGRLLTSSTEVNIAKVKEMVTFMTSSFKFKRDSSELSVSHESIRTILNDCLDMKRAAARLVPKNHLTRLSLSKEFLAKNSTNIIEQPPYSPDMAPADFFCPKFKLPLRGTRF